MPARPVHLAPSTLCLVGAGGAVGTAARYGVAQVVPAAGGWPWATLLVNVLGAFALGLLLAVLAGPGPESARARRLRLGLGTGLLGGFTTVSGLALEVDTLLRAGEAALALAYAGVTLVAGVAACGAGTVLGTGGALGAARRRGRTA